MNDEELARRLAADIGSEALWLAYQPKVALSDGALVGVEALMRWSPAGQAPVPPSTFIPLAEKAGLIDRLSDWGLDEALRQMRAWSEELDVPTLAFNLSPHSLGRLEVPDEIAARCTAHGVESARLVMELTEGATQPLVNLLDTLTRLRIKGFGLSIDDFGVGYSTLLQLRQLPFSEVKIDRAFVADAHADEDCGIITRSIVALAHDLGMAVTAEGVEEAAALRFMREVGCDRAQGYGIARPLRADALVEWHRGWPARWRELVG